MKRKHETADCANYELLKAFAKRGRTHSTQAESMLWEALRGNQLGCKFRRQHIIGNYIADFACIRFKLVIEIDGAYHLQGNQPLMDAERTADLKSRGFTVLRFTNEQVLHRLSSVISQILKSLDHMSQAEQIKNNSQETNLVTPLASSPLSGGQRGASAWAVDAACSGNPGPMEYRGIDLATGVEIFHFGPVHGTNNVGEFLAIVHALALLWKQGDTQKTIYSDSYNAILWVKKKQCKTKLKRTPQTEQLYQIISRAEQWLKTHAYRNPVVKWETAEWGEIPADFGRK